jgi:hypothetical protein
MLATASTPLLAQPVSAQNEAPAARSAADASADADADAAAADDGSEAGAAPRQARATARTRSFRPSLRTGVDDVLLELGATPEHPDSSASAWLRATPYLQWQPARAWEFRASLRLDAVRQSGSVAYSDANAELDETWVRWRSGDTKLSAGLQTILWGRVDGVPLIDRVSRVDISRVLLDDLPERRDPQAALRWEQALGDWTLDAVLLPDFQGAELPDADSIWNPLNRRSGRVLGIAMQPALAALVRTGRVDQDDGGDGGGALRLTRTGEPFDVGFTLGRTRQSLPYFRPDFQRGTLTAVHPFNSFAGVDAEWVSAGATWRTELVFSRGVPLTTPLGQAVDARALEWVGAVEFFPGGGDTRVNLQLVSRRLHVDGSVLELTSYLGVNGEVETVFGQGRWKLGLQFASGLSVHDLYLSPRLSYTGFEPHEITLSLHGFRGNERTLGGFYQHNAYVALGVRTQF